MSESSTLTVESISNKRLPCITDRASESPPSLVRLPRELQLMIFRLLTSTDDIINLQLSHSLLSHVFNAHEKEICTSIGERCWRECGALELLELMRKDLLLRENTDEIIRSCMGLSSGTFGEIKRVLCERPSREANPAPAANKQTENPGDGYERKRAHEHEMPVGGIGMDFKDLQALEVLDRELVSSNIAGSHEYQPPESAGSYAYRGGPWEYENSRRSPSEIKRTKRAIYSAYKMMKYMHFHFFYEGLPVIRKGDREIGTWEMYNPVPMIIDVQALFENCSIEEHMHIAALYDHMPPRFRKAYSSESFGCMLDATLFHRLLCLDAPHEVASGRLTEMFRVVYNSLRDSYQPEVPALLRKIDQCGFPGGFNRNRYRVLRAQTGFGATDQGRTESKVEVLVPDILERGSLSLWCRYFLSSD
ncbi:hypothetical protein BJ508DRAFT_305561 [Ascobolus immersus RN42]|uniref:F-box domain-containing protein n=1 Tax=Ascobolus immersus RN42 TaxID=1160509 RepID=A0A3N4ILD0_ASCIM|nr:hypothetical protein BJ508DRAFT_305561 [Ascobolus immersus RN42]